MKKDNPVVRCIYAENDTELKALVEESFRLFLLRSLASGDPDGIFYFR